MERRKIGSIEVSVIGLGCSNFGRAIDQSVSTEVVAAALDAGINFFDTADVYNKGQSELFLGAALRHRRSEALVATKFGRVANPDFPNSGPEWLLCATPEYVRSAVEASLRRLETDYLDLYILHIPDPATPVVDTVVALNELVVEGKVREIGISAADVDYLREAAAVAQAASLQPFTSVQNRYNLLDRERDGQYGVPEECEQTGMAFVPFAPLASGMLSGKYRRGEAPAPGTRLAGQPIAGYSAENLLTPHNYDVIEAMEDFATQRGHTILDLAFAGLLARPAFASIIAGATSPSQVQMNVAASSWVLTPEEFEEVKRITGVPE